MEATNPGEPGFYVAGLHFCQEHAARVNILCPPELDIQTRLILAVGSLSYHLKTAHGFAGPWLPVLETIQGGFKGCPICFCCDQPAAIHALSMCAAQLVKNMMASPFGERIMENAQAQRIARMRQTRGLPILLFEGDGDFSAYATLAYPSPEDPLVLRAMKDSGFLN